MTGSPPKVYRPGPPPCRVLKGVRVTDINADKRFTPCNRCTTEESCASKRACFIAEERKARKAKFTRAKVSEFYQSTTK